MADRIFGGSGKEGAESDVIGAFIRGDAVRRLLSASPDGRGQKRVLRGREFAFGSRESGQKFFDREAVVHQDEPVAQWSRDLLFEVHAEAGVDGGEKIRHGDRPVFDFDPIAIG